MPADFSMYRLEGDNSAYRLPSGLVAPVVTRGGLEDAGTADSGGAVRVSGVSIQHTPATKLWFGKVSNEPGFRSVHHHHGEAETGGYVLSGRARIYFGDEVRGLPATWRRATGCSCRRSCRTSSATCPAPSRSSG